MDPGPDQNLVSEGLLEEEGEARNLGPVGEPTSEEQRARVSERGQSTDLLLSDQVGPISRPGRESEMPEEVSEPARRGHRNQEIQTLDSGRQDLAGGKLLSQDRARLIDQVQVSIVMESSSAMAQVEFYSSVECSRGDRALKGKEQEAKVEQPALV
jgi:hypothetical protein